MNDESETTATSDHDRPTLLPADGDENPHERVTVPQVERETLPSNQNLMRVFDTAAEGFFVVGALRSALNEHAASEIAHALVARDRRRAHTKWVMAVMACCAALIAAAGSQLG